MSKSNVSVEAIVLSETLEPAIHISYGEKTFQLSPEQAISHALMLIQSAEVAKNDAFFISYLLKDLNLEHEKVRAVINNFRAYRNQRNKENYAPTQPPSSSGSSNGEGKS